MLTGPKQQEIYVINKIEIFYYVLQIYLSIYQCRCIFHTILIIQIEDMMKLKWPTKSKILFVALTFMKPDFNNNLSKNHKKENKHIR